MIFKALKNSDLRKLEVCVLETCKLAGMAFKNDIFIFVLHYGNAWRDARTLSWIVLLALQVATFGKVK